MLVFGNPSRMTDVTITLLQGSRIGQKRFDHRRLKNWTDFSKGTCPIHKSGAPIILLKCEPTSHDVQIITSARSGGSYQITSRRDFCDCYDLDDSAKARLANCMDSTMSAGTDWEQLSGMVTLQPIVELLASPAAASLFTSVIRRHRLLKLKRSSARIRLETRSSPVRAASMGDSQWRAVCSESTNSANWGGKNRSGRCQ